MTSQIGRKHLTVRGGGLYMSSLFTVIHEMALIGIIPFSLVLVRRMI
jgi:hypothetical protein